MLVTRYVNQVVVKVTRDMRIRMIRSLLGARWGYFVRQPVGRLASRVATVLRGKHRPDYTPHADVGDFVIIVNADKVVLTSGKAERKLVHRHSGYPGGLSAQSYVEMLEKHPTRAVEKAIRGMLPKNRLGRQMLGKLKDPAGTPVLVELFKVAPADLAK